MELISLQQLRIVEDMLKQIHESIHNLEVWNSSYKDANELFKQQLLPQRPEIPWNAVKGMRNHIAHGYFDINADLVWDTIKNDLPALKNAVNYFIANLYELMPISD